MWETSLRKHFFFNVTKGLGLPNKYGTRKSQQVIEH